MVIGCGSLGATFRAVVRGDRFRLSRGGQRARLRCGGLRAQELQQAICQGGCFEHLFQEQETAAGVFVLRQRKERLTKLVVAAKSLRSADEPEVELVFEGVDVGHQLGVVALGIVDEIVRVNLEELGEKQARRVSEMRSSAALDLREIGLADRRAVFAIAGFGLAGLLVGFLDGPDELLLGHGAAAAAEIAFDLAKVANFVAQFHISDRNNDITICNKSKRGSEIFASASNRRVYRLNPTLWA